LLFGQKSRFELFAIRRGRTKGALGRKFDRESRRKMNEWGGGRGDKKEGSIQKWKER
jgi:hypothetical protein